MDRKQAMGKREPLLLLTGIGIANFGAWVYLIALNLIVFDMTKSPLAVAGLYIVKPAAALLTNAWAGSIIDRVDQRRLMVVLDLLRAALIACLPFTDSLLVIYVLVLVINMAASVFEPASMSYMTKLIPKADRQRFNALRSFVDSGAFLIGPAIAGILFMIGTPVVAIYVNAGALLVSAFILGKMPKLMDPQEGAALSRKPSWMVIRSDWQAVAAFARKSAGVMLVFVLFSGLMVMTAAMDSQEAAFAKAVHGLSDSEYGFLVSIAGAGIIMGAAVNAAFTKSLSVRVLIGSGSVMVALGYAIYALSSSFLGAAAGFFLLAFSLAFANTGFHTFIQQHIPTHLMGRVLSVFGLLEAALVIAVTILIGAAAELLPVQPVLIAAAVMMLVVASMLFAASFRYAAENKGVLGAIKSTG